jgi:hypothetical protein
MFKTKNDLSEGSAAVCGSLDQRLGSGRGVGVGAASGRHPAADASGGRVSAPGLLG